MAGLKWNTGKLYYSTVELGYQQQGQRSGNHDSTEASQRFGEVLVEMDASDQ
jgi:hypothetical protein